MPDSIPAQSSAHLNARLFALSPGSPRTDGTFVLYWMHQARRRSYNFALQHAIYRAREHGCPVLVVEDLCLEQQWTGRRHFAFALAGMEDNRASFRRLSWLQYLPLVERQPGDLRSWAQKLVADAVEVVTEQVPCGVSLPINEDLARYAAEAGIRATAVDTNGFLLDLLDAPCSTAAAFRRHLHRHAAAAWGVSHGLTPVLVSVCRPWEIPAAWQAWAAHDLIDQPSRLADLPLDQSVPEVLGRGGRKRGLEEMKQWLTHGLNHYDQRNQPDSDGPSGLSPYLHWGHVSTWDILEGVTSQDEQWDIGRIPEKGGKRLGFWPLAETSQLLLDELVTWRELSYHTAHRDPNGYDRFTGLPDFAQKTLSLHAADQRKWCYDLKQFERAETAEPLWNAIQRQPKMA